MMPAIAARCPDVVLVLAGDGPCRPTARISPRGSTSKPICASSARATTWRICWTHRTFVVVPSQIEGFPLAVVEALAHRSAGCRL